MGNQVPPFILLRVLALAGTGSGSLRVDRSRDPRGHRTRAGNRGDGRALGRRRAVQRTRPHDKAASAAREVAANGILPFLSSWALFELVEAAVRIGDTELARDALDRLAEATQPAGTDLALGIEARSRALLADGDAAEASYREAIARLGRHAPSARTRARPSLFGEWLRREGRPRDAREQLRAAEEMFADIGMEAFAGRARDELVAAGAQRAQARPRGAGGAQPAGGADRPARPRRADERRHRRQAVPQPAHGRVAPAQGVRQVGDRVARRPLPRPVAAGATGSCAL